MTRLFTALWPPEEVVAALAEQVAGLGLHEDPGLRVSPDERWHVTLAFHGEDDPGRRARELDERVSGARAPRLRTAGLGEFPGVLWAGVHPAGDADAAALADLVARAGGSPQRHVPHVTLARTRRRPRGGVEEAAVSAVAGSGRMATGPWWTPSEVLLVASLHGRSGWSYQPVHRVRIGPGA